MANDIFLKIDGLEGDSVDAAGNKHAGSISVLAWSWGMTQTGTTHLATGGGSGKVSVNDISVTKRIDTTSHNLHQSCCDGTHFATATLTMRKAGGKNPVEFLKIEMKDVIISSLSSSVAAESESLIENLTLNFGSFRYTYAAQDKDGNPLGGDKVSSWDIPKNTPAA